MPNDRTSRTVLIVVHCIAGRLQVLACFYVSQEEQGFAEDLVPTFNTDPAKLGGSVALNLPVIRNVTFTCAAVPRDLLSATKRSLVAWMWVQISACWIMLESHSVTTSESLPCLAHLALSFRLFDCPDAVVAVSKSDSCDYLLTTAHAKVHILRVDTKITRMKVISLTSTRFLSFAAGHPMCTWLATHLTNY